MRRISSILIITALAVALGAPAALAADPQAERTGTVQIAFNGDVTIPAGDQADFVLVTGGIATVAGEVETLVVLDGAAVLQGATVETVFVNGGSVSLDAQTTVTGDVRTLDSTVTRDPAATVGGTISSVDADLIAATAVIAPAILLFMLGFVLVTLVAGLALAALGARQVRAAEALITREPGETILFGLAGLVVIPLVAVLAIVTIIGAPLGLAILLMVWPAAAFAGYLVAGIWIGEWLLNRGTATERPARPYLAAVVGLVILQVVSLVPFVGAIASLFGFGAVLLLAWRTFRQPTTSQPAMTPPATQPLGV
ncbi:MAG: hypothetical protein A2Z32_02965 [Chloroflexi bacterium RBG_16_69_14]|nr:MAG: hypothetical protein A2Z32_02965 [Chloroflexi bacterium RBG_16_69_14]